MVPFEELKNTPWSELASVWEEQCRHCETVQKAVLLDILSASCDTAIGKQYGFAEIDSVEAFRQRVPVIDYEDIRVDIEAIVAGATDILFQGSPKVFLQSSGTTGKPKMIPDTTISAEIKYMVQTVREIYAGDTVLAALKRKPQFDQLAADKGWENGRNTFRRKIFTDCHILPLVNASPGKKTKSNVQVDFSSNQSARKSNTQKLLVYPLELAEIEDKEAMQYLMMMFALRFDDIIEIAGNHAGRLKAMIDYTQAHSAEIIQDIRHGTISPRLKLTQRERAMLEHYLKPLPQRAQQLEEIRQKQEFIPRYYWPYLSGCLFWLSGKIGQQVQELTPYVPEGTAFWDVGYGSSEAKINIPVEAGCGNGTLATFACFFEFMRVSDGQIFCAWEVEVNEIYVLLLTTYAGLYRYNLHDIVRVDGFTGTTPKVTFVLRQGDILSIGQEKFPADLLCQLVEQIVDIRLCQIWLNFDAHRYELYLELEAKETRLAAELALVIDEYLQQQFEAYGRYRQYGVIEPLAVHLMTCGRLEQLLEKTVKIPMVLKEPMEDCIE